MVKGKLKAPKESLDHFIDAIAFLQASLSDEITGIAISMPGAINSENGYCYTGGAYTFIKDLPLAELIQDRCLVPVTIGNDAKCAAEAELAFGVLHGVSDAAVIVLGTGIGGAIILNSHVHEGKNFVAGEFSWVRTDGNDGNNLDKLWISQNGIAGLSGLVHSYLSTDVDYSGLEIFKLAMNGNELVRKAIDEFCRRLAVQIYNLQATFDFEKVAIGGGISVQPLLLELTNKHINEMYEFGCKYDATVTKPQVVICKYKNDANLLGAYLIHQKYTKIKK